MVHSYLLQQESNKMAGENVVPRETEIRGCDELHASDCETWFGSAFLRLFNVM
jgi:hypothetical protein